MDEAEELSRALLELAHEELGDLAELGEAQREFESDPIGLVFGPRGLLSQKLEGYEARIGQVSLAYAVHAAMQDGGSLLAEAPTGTGKSLAYGVPATWHAARTGNRVVIVTANIALQEQLVAKDLPLLRSILPWPFTFALAKGIGNYLCLDRLDDTRAELTQEFDENADYQRWPQVLEWAGKTKTGDLNELPFEARGRLRMAFTTTSDECTGRLCGRYDECHAQRARAAARDAQVVVTNYHLFFADLVVKRAREPDADGKPTGVLPPYDCVVMDEGHKAADIARDYVGFRLTAGGAKWCARLLVAKNNPRSKKAPLPPLDPALKQRIGDAADALFRELGQYARSEAYEVRLRERHCVHTGQPLVELLRQAAEVLFKNSTALPLPAERRVELQAAAVRCTTFADCLRRALELEKNGELVYFIEEMPGGKAALCSKPIVVADWLRDALFENPEMKATIVTSATLTVGESFDHVQRELGAEGAEGMIAESPFDWKNQAVVVVPEIVAERSFPAPDKEAFGEAMAWLFVQVVKAARGRTLGLFTSYKQLELAHRRLIDAGLPYAVFRQGEAPRMQLVARFKQDVASVLLGTESFWQGVDVPGEALSCLVIDKLPFESIDDPINDAVAARDKRAFQHWTVPRAVIQARQGIGRLIRSRSDRGVIVFCDRRICDKSYGRMFTRSFPEGLRVVRRIEEVGEFLK